MISDNIANATTPATRPRLDVRVAGHGFEQFDILFLRRRDGVRSRQYHTQGLLTATSTRPTSPSRATASSRGRRGLPAVATLIRATAPSTKDNTGFLGNGGVFLEAGVPMRAGNVVGDTSAATCRPSIPRSSRPAPAPRPRPRSWRTCPPTPPMATPSRVR